MKILSHRGYWNSAIPKNSSKSFEHSFINNFGTETDLRDLDDEIVISHDMPKKSDNYLTFKEFLNLYKKFSTIENNLPLALNIKSDGLVEKIANLILDLDIKNHFFFDMSIPDQITYISKGLKTFSRHSEYEQNISFYDHVYGVWLDSFNELWYTEDIIRNHLSNKKIVSIVSLELHKREYKSQWNFLKKSNLYKENNIYLCTDLPNEAKIFFNE